MQGTQLVGAGRTSPSGRDDLALREQTGGSGRGGTGARDGEPEPASPAHPSTSPFEETCRRTNRPPILVTISYEIVPHASAQS